VNESVEVVKAKLAGAVLVSVMFLNPEALIAVVTLTKELRARGVRSEEIDAVFDAVSSLKDRGKQVCRNNVRSVLRD